MSDLRVVQTQVELGAVAGAPLPSEYGGRHVRRLGGDSLAVASSSQLGGSDPEAHPERSVEVGGVPEADVVRDRGDRPVRAAWIEQETVGQVEAAVENVPAEGPPVALEEQVQVSRCDPVPSGNSGDAERAIGEVVVDVRLQRTESGGADTPSCARTVPGVDWCEGQGDEVAGVPDDDLRDSRGRQLVAIEDGAQVAGQEPEGGTAGRDGSKGGDSVGKVAEQQAAVEPQADHPGRDGTQDGERPVAQVQRDGLAGLDGDVVPALAGEARTGLVDAEEHVVVPRAGEPDLPHTGEAAFEERGPGEPPLHEIHLGGGSGQGLDGEHPLVEERAQRSRPGRRGTSRVESASGAVASDAPAMGAPCQGSAAATRAAGFHDSPRARSPGSVPGAEPIPSVI